MDMGIQGRTALVCGPISGLGCGRAEAFSHQSRERGDGGINPWKLEATAKATAIRAQGGVTVRLWRATSLHPTDALPR
jgi:hypothetical protein